MRNQPIFRIPTVDPTTVLEQVSIGIVDWIFEGWRDIHFSTVQDAVKTGIDAHIGRSLVGGWGEHQFLAEGIVGNITGLLVIGSLRIHGDSFRAGAALSADIQPGIGPAPRVAET